MIRTTSLDSGLQVVTERMADVRSVALSFWVGTGSRDEQAAEWGMSHFLEHLLFKGSDSRSALEIAEAIDGVGGDMNAFTTKECTAFYVRVLAEDCEIALDILCDIMCAPAFDVDEIECERQVVLEEILMRGDEPADLAHEYLSAAMFKGHTLGREVLGDEERITAMNRESIRSFFDHHYRSNNMVFAAAGALDHDDIVRRVGDRWQQRNGGARPQRTAPTVASGARVVNRRPSDQAHLVVGVPAPDRHSNLRYATSLLDVVVGGGMSSRLFQEVRERRGLAYTVYSSYTPYHDVGEFVVYVGTAPRRANEVLDVVQTELAAIKAKGITQAELDRAKQHLRTTTALNLEDSGARMSRIGRSLLLHGDVLTTDEVMARINSVTLDDVASVAQNLFDVEPVVVAVGPVDDNLKPAKVA